MYVELNFSFKKTGKFDIDTDRMWMKYDNALNALNIDMVIDEAKFTTDGDNHKINGRYKLKP